MPLAQPEGTPPPTELGSGLPDITKIPGFLSRLEDLGLGKPVIFRNEKPPISSEVQSATGITVTDQLDDEEPFIRLGHILPCNRAETEHVVILPDGTLLYMEANSSVREGGFQNSVYFNLFSQTGNGDITKVYKRNFSALEDKSLRSLLSDVSGSVGCRTLDGRIPANTDFVTTQFHNALKIAEEIKAEMTASALKMQNETLKGLTDLLRPPS